MPLQGFDKYGNRDLGAFYQASTIDDDCKRVLDGCYEASRNISRIRFCMVQKAFLLLGGIVLQGFYKVSTRALCEASIRVLEMC